MRKIMLRHRIQRPVLAACLLLAGLAAASAAAPKTVSYDKDVKPLLEKYCWDCHADGSSKGGVTLDKYADSQERLADLKGWEHVLNNVRNGVMPPEKKPQ